MKKPIPGYPGYQADTRGNIWGIKGTILKGRISNSGYIRYCLCKETIPKAISGHRLIALTFIPNPLNKPCVNHKDGVKTNNSIANLEWVTYSENELHSVKFLKKEASQRGKTGTKSGNYKVLALHYRGEEVFRGIQAEIAEYLGFSRKALIMRLRRKKPLPPGYTLSLIKPYNHKSLEFK